MQLFSYPLLIVVLDRDINQSHLAFFVLRRLPAFLSSLLIWSHFLFGFAFPFSFSRSHISAYDFLWLCSFVTLMWTLCLLKGRVRYFIVSFTTKTKYVLYVQYSVQGAKKIPLLYIQSMVIRLKGDILRHTAINLHYYIVRISRERYNSECLQTENTVETLSKPAFLVNVVKID